MLHEFLKTHRSELIARCSAKATKRNKQLAGQSQHGIPRFLDQLIETFRLEQTPEALKLHQAAGHGRPSLALVPPDIASTAAMHGEELQRQGRTVDQVVHDYGDLCQALTELAMEKDTVITVDEFHTFNRCSDDAIADAVTSFARVKAGPAAKLETAPQDAYTQLRAEQVRVLIERALVSFAVIKDGGVGTRGATAILHEQSLVALRDLFAGADVRDVLPRVGPR